MIRRIPIHLLMPLLALFLYLPGVYGQNSAGHAITVDGRDFRLNGKPFPLCGVSFFNAIYNPAFHESEAARSAWLKKFRGYGINYVRVWAQWDNKRGFVDSCADCTLYNADGSLKPKYLERLQALIGTADELGMVVELAVFARESWNENLRLSDAASEEAVRNVTLALKPHRNLVIQIWNEFDYRVVDYVKVVRAADPQRLVTNSPGYGGVLGSKEENAALDFLSPHTSRQGAGKPWEIAPKEIAYLLARYNKPVVDDEPARNGTANFGGPKEPTQPMDHILQIHEVRQAGGYPLYHHDMFQLGYGAPSTPPSGIPDPEFSPYHQQVFEYLRLSDRYR
ncbi:MAG: cellulase family glycosylhydrolase [Bryobacterales bacterium]|nr:cellulase family glycosylhydrolase [Bryobacterales bacterium]